MAFMKRVFLYIKYYFEPNDKYVRSLAFDAAKKYFNTPVRNASNPYPRVVEYDMRRMQFSRYQQAFNDSYRHNYAKQKLANHEI